MNDKRFWVEVVRDDGSYTYKGPLRWNDAVRERDAWRQAFSTCRANIQEKEHAIKEASPLGWVPDAEFPTVGTLILAWSRATKDGSRFYPYGKVGR